jgi:hypothetical protein
MPREIDWVRFRLYARRSESCHVEVARDPSCIRFNAHKNPLAEKTETQRAQAADVGQGSGDGAWRSEVSNRSVQALFFLAEKTR